MKKLVESSAFKALAAFIGALLVMAGLQNPYYVGILNFLGINLIITIGLSLLMGYAGQISLGQAAFFGIGAYTTGILTTKLYLPLVASFPSAVALTVLVAFLVGIPTLKLRGHYLAMATLGLGEIVYIIFNELVFLTGGPSGFGNIPQITILGIPLDNDYRFFMLVWTAVACVLFISLNLINSRIGRALKALHKEEKTAAVFGIDTSRLKLYIFVLGAGFAGIAGFLYAHYVTFLSPGTFSLNFSILLVTMVAVGGMGSIWGAIMGTCVLTILPEILRSFRDFDILVYGFILLIIMLVRPEGLYGIRLPFAVKLPVKGRS
ncbi:MAG: branched-chain amino acid ABC transporter permease [Spirochaetota bacterium]